jgi:hypothetical protein
LPNDGLPSNENDVITGVKLGVKEANRFPQQPSYTVASDRGAQILASHKTIAIVDQPIRSKTQRNPTMVKNTSLLAQTSKIFVTPKAEALLHPTSLRFPVHLLHMVTSHSQNMTPSQAAAL